MASEKTRAVVLKRRNLGESDRVLTLFTRELGIVSAIAKGSRRPKSRFSSATDLFNESDYILSAGKVFYIVTDINLVNAYLSNTKTLEKIKVADAMAEITIKLFPDEYPITDIYEALIESLNLIDVVDVRMVYIYFVSRVLNKLGNFPEINKCVACHDKVAGEVFISNNSGGILCQNCKSGNVSKSVKDNNSIKLWRYINANSSSKLKSINVNEDALTELFYILNSFIADNAQIEIRSLNL